MRIRGYSEGTWFGVPLGDDQYGLGVVARSNQKVGVILAYFFSPIFTSLPPMTNLPFLTSDDSIMVIHVGDLGLVNGEWPVIGKLKHWDRKQWPTPSFVRREPVSNRCWKVVYSDDDPNMIISETLISEVEARKYDLDALAGYKSAEHALAKRLTDGLES